MRLALDVCMLYVSVRIRCVMSVDAAVGFVITSYFFFCWTILWVCVVFFFVCFSLDFHALLLLLLRQADTIWNERAWSWNWWNQERNHGIHLVLSLWLWIFFAHSENMHTKKHTITCYIFYVSFGRDIRVCLADYYIIMLKLCMYVCDVTQSVIFLLDRNRLQVIFNAIFPCYQHLLQSSRLFES